MSGTSSSLEFVGRKTQPLLTEVGFVPLHRDAKTKARARTPIFSLLSVGAFFALLWFRRPIAFLHPGLWAEDGIVFFREAHENGWRAVFEPYAGYFHLLPRLAAFITDFFSAPGFVPWSYEIELIAVYLVVLLFIASPRFRVPYKPLLALTLIAAPVGNEVFLNLTNLQWIASIALLVVLLSEEPVGSLGKLTDLSAVLLTGFSGLQAVFFLPLFVVRGYRRRTSFNSVLLMLLGVIAFVQLSHMSSERSPGTFRLLNPEFFLVIDRPLYAILFGVKEIQSKAALALAAWLTAATIVGAGGVLLVAAKRRNTPALYCLGAAALVMGAVLVSVRGNPAILAFGGERYFYLPTVLFIWSLVLLLRDVRWFSGPLLGLIAALTVINGSSFSDRSPQDNGWAKHAACIGKSYPCVLPIRPDGWAVALTKGHG